MEVIITVAVLLIGILIIGEVPELIKKRAKAKKENAEIEGEKKLKADEVSEFDKNLIRLEKLGKLYKDGIITKEEFEEKRSKFKL
tara:strand:- start:558 stop:812 length:255 start_codon:yes stop_codon:yes gene_type:complete